MRTLVFGPRGFLGANFVNHFRGTGSVADIADRSQVSKELDAHRPDVVINSAGKPGRPNVDWCEQHPLETLRSNVTGSLVLLEECLARGIYLVHLSSGCLYSGDKDGAGYGEDDPPNFQGSWYVRSKVWSEQMLREFPVLILRPRMVFDGSLHPRNLLVKLATYPRLLDEPNSLTYVPDLLRAAEQLIRIRVTGVFNVVNRETRSPYEIMQQYRRVCPACHAFERLPASELGQVASAGRSSCVLSTAKLQRLGICLPEVGCALTDALNSICRYGSAVPNWHARTGGPSHATSLPTAVEPQ